MVPNSRSKAQEHAETGQHLLPASKAESMTISQMKARPVRIMFTYAAEEAVIHLIHTVDFHLNQLLYFFDKENLIHRLTSPEVLNLDPSTETPLTVSQAQLLVLIALGKLTREKGGRQTMPPGDREFWAVEYHMPAAPDMLDQPSIAAETLCMMAFYAEAINRPDLSILHAVAVKTTSSSEVVLLARAAGYDSVFIDLEHSTLSIQDSSTLCTTALLANVTPFVRVPHNCGSGFVQRVLDGGAVGVVYPHVNTAEEARQAVAVAKFPPLGTRSLTAALPHFLYERISASQVIAQVNEIGSTVVAMIETSEAVRNAPSIAAVLGVDVLLLGANDLSLELGILGEWEHPRFQDALKTVAEACRANGKIFGISGIYTKPNVVRAAVRELGARYVLGHSDMGLLSMAMNKNADMLRELQQ
ncbi:hpcH/HpaI aldolase/citrate lyase family protein [Sarocladium implicatum]|nr:hpcH/HpaI aldolase/citrate lyase family protein [Sarocladium implicatum]